MTQVHPNFFKLGVLNLHPYASLAVVGRHQISKCHTCGRTRNASEGPATAHFADRGRAWYDFLHTENGFLLISDRVRDGLIRNEIGGWESFPVSVVGVESRSLRKKNMPQYHWLKITGQIEVDDSKDIIGDVKYCPECKHLEGIKGPDRLVPIARNLAEIGFFNVSNFWFSYIVCSYGIIELARSQKWTNMRFDPIDLPGRIRPLPEPINYLGDPWPPVSWYPDEVDPDPRNFE